MRGINSGINIRDEQAVFLRQRAVQGDGEEQRERGERKENFSRGGTVEGLYIGDMIPALIRKDRARLRFCSSLLSLGAGNGG